MKNLIAIAIAVFMVLCVSTLSYADNVTIQKEITINMQVDSQFGMQIWDGEFNQQLSTVLPGLGATGDIHIYATSNHSIPWLINASSSGLVGETQTTPDTLPVKVSTYANGIPLTGTIVTDLELTSSAQSIYTAGAGEYPCLGLLVGCIFSVTSETTTKEDIYSGTVVLTMTE